ncbi:hypothetical protein I4F81_002862 [Pyropia yezoensis]|uniref:Uncharacterized protein n=1 Tax=Pyropia yezoensis TaxID=2788 RepID=A0ACC3BQQ3_PYRYE|nr:hypothetical protein I4F81_002862 [Neopyropia yezoensis]
MGDRQGGPPPPPPRAGGALPSVNVAFPPAPSAAVGAPPIGYRRLGRLAAAAAAAAVTIATAVTVAAATAAHPIPAGGVLPLAGRAEAPAPVVRWNAGGPPAGLFAADGGGTYVLPADGSGSAGGAGPSAVHVASDRPIRRGRGWSPLYLTHRWAVGRLRLAFPVPPGTYTVTLLWAEVWFSSRGRRVMRVAVGDTVGEVGQALIPNLDVVAVAGAPNTALVRTFQGVTVSSGGALLVTLDGLVQNPMVSGVVVRRVSAAARPPAATLPPPTPPPAATAEPPLAPAPQTGGGEATPDHRAHAVPGGPYEATDFSKNGTAPVTLDGILSHSHYFAAGPPAVSGLVVRYVWAHAATGVEIGRGPVITHAFPTGVTPVRLTVTDNTGDVATAVTTVTVRTAFTPGAYFYGYPAAAPVGGTVGPRGLGTKSSLPADGLSLLPLSANGAAADAVRPTLGTAVERIAFWSAADFPGAAFTTAAEAGWGARLVAELRPRRSGPHTLSVIHDGPVRVLLDGVEVLSGAAPPGGGVTTTTAATPVELVGGSSTPLQVLYWQASSKARLVLQMRRPGEAKTYAVQAGELGYDTAAVLPVLTSVSRRSGSAAGGDRLLLKGSGLLNDFRVMFGDVEAENVMRSAADGTEVVVLVPARPADSGAATVDVRVVNGVGASNALPFDYIVGGAPPVRFSVETLKAPDGTAFTLGQGVTCSARGPDGRYYFGTQGGVLHVVTVDESRGVVTDGCATVPLPGGRSILGLSFPPSDVAATRLFVSTSVLFWLDRGVLPYASGWRNGRVDLYTPTADGCWAYGRPVLSGLPVSNHDHGVNGHAWDDDGRLYVSVGGSTNAGVAVRGATKAERDLIGGVPDSPLSAAVLVADVDAPGFDGAVTYNAAGTPDVATIRTGNVSVYASGVRNAFALAYTSRGAIYAADNGPNAGYGPASTSCTTRGADPQTGDALLRITAGAYYGSPNRNRGREDPRQCVYVAPMGPRPAGGDVDAAPGLAGVQSSTNGVLEYGAATFANALRGEILLSKFAGQSNGLLYRARPAPDGADTPLDADGVRVLIGRSGLAIFEDPTGGLVMADPRADTVTRLAPVYPVPSTATLIGVAPSRGRAAGGNALRVTGHRLGGAAATVTVGGRPCTGVRDVAAAGDALTCTVPAGAAGAVVDVVVVGPAGRALSYGSEYRYMRL